MCERWCVLKLSLNFLYFLILIVHYCFFHRENPIEIERERERKRATDTTRAADGEGRPHRCSHEEVSKRSIISSKHSSTAHLWFFHRPDNIPDDASRMTIATSGSHLRGQHRWGWSQCGWAAWGRGERSQRSKPSINFDTSHRLFLSLMCLSCCFY